MKSSLNLRALAALFFFLLSSPAFAVRNGEFVKPDDISGAAKFTALVKVYNEQGEMIQRCTGTLIDTQALLTAAHCLPNDSALVWVDFGVNSKDSNFYSATSTKFIAHQNYRTIRKEGLVIQQVEAASADLKLLELPDSQDMMNYDESFYRTQLELHLKGGANNFEVKKNGEPNIPYHDVGLIFLKYPVPARLKPVKFANHIDLSYGKRIFSFGFGIFGERFSDVDEQLRKTETNLTSIVAKGNDVSHLVTFAFGESNVCIGDSGGPALVREAEGYVLAGVISAQGNLCHGYTYFALPHYDREWMQQEALHYIGRELQL